MTITAAQMALATAELDQIQQGLNILSAMSGKGVTTVNLNIELPGFNAEDDDGPGLAGMRCSILVSLSAAQSFLTKRQTALQALIV